MSAEDKRPRLGPFLRQYAEQETKTPRERAQEVLLGGAAALGMLVVLLGVLVAFVRFPLFTLGVLIAVWGIGLILLMVNKRRSDARERELRQAIDSDEHLPR